MSTKAMDERNEIHFSLARDHYRHIAMHVENDEATITLTIDPNHGFFKDVPLKLNSYDLAVDIELADVLNRLRFETPHVRTVVITSGHPQIFSSGANIYMLKKSSHALKVNFCKFTNETRLYLEEASQFSDMKFICALNGTAAGGGYELALACDRIVLIDDKNANVSLPEVPLLGVLPGTGGLTRLVDKRKVRRDIADVFCTVAEGFKGQKAKDLRLVDEIYQKSKWSSGLKEEVALLKGRSVDKKDRKGITLNPIRPEMTSQGFCYRYVDVNLTEERIASITIKGPDGKEPTNVAAMLERGEDLWLIKAFRELDDAILRLRFLYRDHGLWQFRTRGEAALVLDAERPLYEAFNADTHWFLREIALLIGRVYRRIDVSSRSLMAVVGKDSNFAGVLSELLLIADRSYAEDVEATIHWSPLSRDALATWTGDSRLKTRFYGDKEALVRAERLCDGTTQSLKDAYRCGLITFLLDSIDFHDEIRIFKEERASLSPDALLAMEANLRFVGPETMATKIFGRLSAWQNWVFIRDNATGPQGALMSYGEDRRPSFTWERS